MSKFKPTDSGIEFDIRRVSFIQLEMLSSMYQSSYPNKPKPPVKEIIVEGEVVDIVELSLDVEVLERELKKATDANKELLQQDLDKVNTYLKAKAKWDADASAAQWQATRLLYAKHLESPIDQAAVDRVVKENQEFGSDLRQQIRDLYAKYDVPFDEDYMDKWIYLWCVCITSVYDSGALNTWMQTGSQEARQVMRQAANFLI